MPCHHLFELYVVKSYREQRKADLKRFTFTFQLKEVAAIHILWILLSVTFAAVLIWMKVLKDILRNKITTNKGTTLGLELSFIVSSFLSFFLLLQKISSVLVFSCLSVLLRLFYKRPVQYKIVLYLGHPSQKVWIHSYLYYCHISLWISH